MLTFGNTWPRLTRFGVGVARSGDGGPVSVGTPGHIFEPHVCV